MTNVTIEQAVKGYLVFSAKEGKLFREGRSYLAGKTYHNRYLAIYEKLEDAAVLKKLAQDKNQQVRSAAAENANTPALVLAKLGVAAEVNAMAI